MIEAPKIGILPLYLSLYEQVRPEFTPTVRRFAKRVADRLRNADLEVQLGEIGCEEPEISDIVHNLLGADIDLLATLHLAYSPSLESVGVLADLDIPVILLDTTPSPTFGPNATSEDMMANHGIHGVQDLACMLRRSSRQYGVIAGHIDDDRFVSDVASATKGAKARRSLQNSTTLVVGEEFQGMGDFRVDPAVLRSVLGIQTRHASVRKLASALDELDDEDINAEFAEDCRNFDCDDIPDEILARSNWVGLAMRRLVQDAGATAFSFNFQSFTREAGLPTVPFLEASKAMARGIGYAGEADAMTAAFVGALIQGFEDVTFTEMFCPDWAEDAIFMSHMGECNVALAAEGPPKLVEKDYAFGDVDNPAVAVFKVRPGPATLVNIAPGPKYAFNLISVAVEVLDRGPQPGFPDVPHFWIRPVNHNLRDTLRLFSEAGGTHHSALILGDEVTGIRNMAAMLGVEFTEV